MPARGLASAGRTRQRAGKAQPVPSLDLWRDGADRQSAFNSTNSPTPIAGPSKVASTIITNDFATITQHPALHARMPTAAPTTLALQPPSGRTPLQTGQMTYLTTKNMWETRPTFFCHNLVSQMRKVSRGHRGDIAAFQRSTDVRALPGATAPAKRLLDELAARECGRLWQFRNQMVTPIYLTSNNRSWRSSCPFVSRASCSMRSKGTCSAEISERWAFIARTRPSWTR